MATDFQQRQRELAQHLRNPQVHAAPDGLEDRRLAIYRDLIFNNIEGFLSGGFPVLRQLYSQHDWLQLVRDFIDRHRSESPYFLEISQEFQHWLREERPPQPDDYPFMLELAHYEWVELALDVATDVLPDRPELTDVLHQPLQLSPRAWLLSYQYPVHRISVDFLPEAAPEVLTCLVVYRNREHQVKFMEVNQVTLQLLLLLQAQPGQAGVQLIHRLAEVLSLTDVKPLLSFGAELLEQLKDCHIVL